jgi:hypothetical protein
MHRTGVGWGVLDREALGKSAVGSPKPPNTQPCSLHVPLCKGPCEPLAPALHHAGAHFGEVGDTRGRFPGEPILTPSAASSACGVERGGDPPGRGQVVQDTACVSHAIWAPACPSQDTR